MREHPLIKGFVGGRTTRVTDYQIGQVPCMIASLIQPSSVECMFLLPSNSFGDAQSRSMEDYVESSISVLYIIFGFFLLTL